MVTCPSGTNELRHSCRRKLPHFFAVQYEGSGLDLQHIPFRGGAER